MKKVIRPEQREEAVYFSDFTGKPFKSGFPPPVELKINFNFGSKYDGASLDLHLSDDDVDSILPLLREKLSKDAKKQTAEALHVLDLQLEESIEARDFSSCDNVFNARLFILKLLGLN
jgi:hypothetical protein